MTSPTRGKASAQPDRIKGHTASMAHVIGLNQAKACIHPGMATSGTNAELRKIIGSERKPSTEKKSP